MDEFPCWPAQEALLDMIQTDVDDFRCRYVRRFLPRTVLCQRRGAASSCKYSEDCVVLSYVLRFDFRKSCE